MQEKEEENVSNGTTYHPHSKEKEGPNGFLQLTFKISAILRLKVCFSALRLKEIPFWLTSFTTTLKVEICSFLRSTAN